MGSRSTATNVLAERRTGRGRRPQHDPARQAAYDALRLVTEQGAYANLALADLLSERGLDARDAAFATELLYGTCRRQGTYDRVIVAASGRTDLQPDVLDVLRLGTHQLLAMRVADHAAVGSTVDLARLTVGERVGGLVNAVLRKVAACSYAEWVERLSVGLDPVDALALRTCHPRWIVEAYTDRLPAHEVEPALEANNLAASATLAVRPGIGTLAELVTAGATPSRWSPYAASWVGDPGTLPAIKAGRAGVQDEGSQLVALALTRAETDGAPRDWWLDLCAGPGGKAALLTGLAHEQGAQLLAGERRPHRAGLVRQALRGYPSAPVVVADGLRPPWRRAGFDRVIADVPCTGLGALRRRPEARWRRSADDLAELDVLQRSLLTSALDAARPGGVVAYVTCSPHRAETSAVVEAVLADRPGVEVLDAPALLPEVPDASRDRYLQLWPHRHGTDAMFCALLRTP